MNGKEQEWKPCPFCGGSDIRHTAHIGAGQGLHRGETLYTMCCYLCGAEFPAMYDLEKLKAKWNRRSGPKK